MIYNLCRKLLPFLLLITFSNGALSEIPDDTPDELARLYQETVNELDLTPEQQLQLFPIMESSFEQRKAVFDSLGINPPGQGMNKRPPFRKMRELKNRMDAIDMDTKRQVSEILTDEQLRKWRKLQNERKQEARRRMMN